MDHQLLTITPSPTLILKSNLTRDELERKAYIEGWVLPTTYVEGGLGVNSLITSSPFFPEDFPHNFVKNEKGDIVPEINNKLVPPLKVDSVEATEYLRTIKLLRAENSLLRQELKQIYEEGGFTAEESTTLLKSVSASSGKLL